MDKPRTEGENFACERGVIKPGEACCGNCGWACPPYNPELDGRYVSCAFYHQDFPIKPVTYCCRAWGSNDNVSCGVVPDWCEPYTRRRLTREEIDANLSSEAVRERLHAKERSGTFKREAALRLNRKAASKDSSFSLQERSESPDQSLPRPSQPVKPDFDKVNENIRHRLKENPEELNQLMQDLFESMPPYIH